MERCEIRRIIMGEIRKVRRDLPENIHPDDNLIEIWNFESIDMAELVARAEQNLKIEIPDSIWKQLVTVNNITDYIFGQIMTG
jgi:acyl carrier protein